MLQCFKKQILLTYIVHLLEKYNKSIFMCFVSILEHTAIIYLYNIKLIGFYDRSWMCLLRGTNTVFK